MQFRFQFDRALQASAYLLRLDGKRMGYLRLLKLLYIADREYLAEAGETITGDRAVAMRYGPVLSHTYDLIKGGGTRAGEWDDYIHTDGYAITLVKDPGRGELSKAVVAKLAEVAKRYREIDEWELSERTHEFPEWIDNTRLGSAPIPWEDVLRAQGKSEMVVAVARDEAARQALDDVFGPEP